MALPPAPDQEVDKHSNNYYHSYYYANLEQNDYSYTKNKIDYPPLLDTSLPHKSNLYWKAERKSTIYSHADIYDS